MTPEDLERQTRDIAVAATAAAEHAIEVKMAAVLAVQVQTLSMLHKKGLIDTNEINDFVTKLEAMSAAMVRTSPPLGKELADLALRLRHALFQSDAKSN